MKKSVAFLIPVVIALTFIPALVDAANSGDFSGGVAIGTGYAGIDAAPTNGLIVQGAIGIGTTNPTTSYELNVSGTGLNPFIAAIVTDVTTGSAAGINVTADDSRLTMTSHASPRTVSRFGLTLGGWAELAIFNNTGTSNGLVIGEEAASPVVFGTNNAERMRIDGSGNVSIGTTTARGGALLDVNGKIYVGSFATGSSTTVCQNSNVLSSCTSARRYKENIEPSELGLNEVLKMRPVTFDLKAHKDNWEKHDFGFVAEDMAKINPLFVTYDEDGKISGVRYMQLTAVNAEAIQELNGMIEKQQNEIDKLKRMVERLTHGK